MNSTARRRAATGRRRLLIERRRGRVVTGTAFCTKLGAWHQPAAAAPLNGATRGYNLGRADYIGPSKLDFLVGTRRPGGTRTLHLCRAELYNSYYRAEGELQPLLPAHPGSYLPICHWYAEAGTRYWQWGRHPSVYGSDGLRSRRFSLCSRPPTSGGVQGLQPDCGTELSPGHDFLRRCRVQRLSGRGI